MINHVRYVLAVLSFITLPPGLLFWFVIHPWARWWRKLGPIRTYVIVLPVVAAFWCATLPRPCAAPGCGSRHALELGGNWRGSLRTLHLDRIPALETLDIATMIGIPELSPTELRKGKLLTDGIYRVVRHPRYLSAGLAVIAVALFVDYVGVYVLIFLLFPLGYPMLLFEERDLVDRFGEEYRQYQREVPRILPRFRRVK